MDELPAFRWSATYTLVAAPQSLTGDKILLPQSALQQLLDRSSSYQPFSVHENSQQLPHPLTFRLVNSQNGNTVYAGIREFSSPEETLALSPFLLDALGIDPQSLVTQPGGDASACQIAVHAKKLHKGSYARLRPLEAGYNPDDWKSLLERHLRENFTCLTRNTTLSVKGVRGETFQFLVDQVAPEGDAICVVDTDLEVDIEALNEEQARETLRKIVDTSTSDASKTCQLDIWKDVVGQVSPQDYMDYELASWDRNQPLTITISEIQDADSLDLFVTPKSSRQRALPRDSAHVLGDFGSAKNGTKCITIAPTNSDMEDAEGVCISVYAYPMATKAQARPIEYKLRAKATPVDAHAHGDQTPDGMRNKSEEEQCQNCLQWIPRRTMALHVNFCQRHNISCPKCQSVFKRDSTEWKEHWHCTHDDAYGNSWAGLLKHNDIFHTDRQCPGCEFATNSLPDLARHRTTVCPGKLILCRFCHLEVPQEGDAFNPSPEVVLSGMTAHELADGARTTECHLCDKIVRLRDMDAHLRHHELDKAQRAKPVLCRNANCGRTRYGVGPRGQLGTRASASTQGDLSNDIGLCALCFGPLYVSMHDPEGKALRRRIERRYLRQMMSGCERAHCGNEWCRTGRANAGLEAKGASAAALLPLVKPLLDAVTRAGAPFYFCVDEVSQRCRKAAETVAETKVWQLEWCVAAAEAERGDIAKVTDWLQAWAPKV